MNDIVAKSEQQETDKYWHIVFSVRTYPVGHFSSQWVVGEKPVYIDSTISQLQLNKLWMDKNDWLRSK